MTIRPYRQVLAPLQLSIERGTETVPDDGAWYLLQAGEQLGRFRSLKQAKAEWDRIVAESGWTPPTRTVDPRVALEREQGERWSRNRGG